MKVDRDSRRNGETGLLDLAYRIAMRGLEMRTGDQQRQFQFGVIANIGNHPMEDTELGATARNNRDFLSSHGESAKQALLGIFITSRSSRSATGNCARGQLEYIGKRCINCQIGRDI